jgi:hypothetical protein
MPDWLLYNSSVGTAMVELDECEIFYLCPQNGTFETAMMAKIILKVANAGGQRHKV